LASRWYVRLGLLLLGVGLLTAAFAPVNQFYLAWIGLVPWLLVLNSTRSRKSAFFWSWLAGTFFFIANMWWMAYVTAPGMVALMGILGLYWGATGVIIRAAVLAGIENRGSRIEDREDKIIRSSILDFQFSSSCSSRPSSSRAANGSAGFGLGMGCRGLIWVTRNPRC
jgi:hypothetical protein